MSTAQVRFITHNFNAILFKNIRKRTSFGFAGHALAYSRTQNAEIFLIFLNLQQAPQIFVSGLSNHLKLALASLCVVFKAIYQKFGRRRMDESYEL